MGDPYQKRESKKYDNPIPSREYILEHVAKQALTQYDLRDVLKITEKQKKPLTHRLRAMVRDRQLGCNRAGEYSIFNYERDIIVGTVSAHPKGFGFIILDEGGKDLRLSAYQMRRVFHGDRVKARIFDARGGAEIVEVLESLKSVVGRLHFGSKGAYIVVDDKRICNNIDIPETNAKNTDQQIVVVEIIQAPTFKTRAQGKIIQILGNYMDEGIETEAILYNNGIPVDFSPETLAQAQSLPSAVTMQDKAGRVDITDMKLLTIDGEDSKDFDDAVFAQPTKYGWKLVVAIADVSHYVEEGSALDIDAVERGNSVYFSRRVVPMLPEKISNGLCSINPNVERLCMACEMNIDTQGKLINYKFYPALMLSHARLTYTEVGKILEQGDEELMQKYSGVMSNLNALYDLYKVLKNARTERGVMDFDRIETKILFDNNGKIDDIIVAPRNDAHRLIEECMITANQATARFLAENNEDFLYRIHPKPTAEKVATTRQFLAAFGLILEGGTHPESKHFAKVLEDAKGRDDENVIKTVVLRTMKQAIYTPVNDGHFGLALGNYTHFTSPIRRYPDLLAHRSIKRILNKKTRKPSKKMVELGIKLSATERRANEATRDVEQWLKCEYMRDKVGEIFKGVISGVFAFGIFIELTDIYTEGMISIVDMKDDYYNFDEVHQQLKGERTGKVFRLGSPIKIQVASVNLDNRQIAFLPA